MSIEQLECDNRFQSAIQLIEAGNLSHAEETLMELVREFPEEVMAWVKLGQVSWELNQHATASEAFRKACDLKPQSETASLGLFHNLWAQGDREGAFSEAKRFISLRPSKEYTAIFAEINGSKE